MHPVPSLIVYALIVLALSLLVIHLKHALFGRLDQLPATYRKLPITAATSWSARKVTPNGPSASTVTLFTSLRAWSKRPRSSG